jgi:hypothetical protein
MLLEKELISGTTTMLPIRLDATPLPGLSTTKAFLDYDAQPCEAIASYLAHRVAQHSGQPAPTLAQSKIEFGPDDVGVTLEHYFRDFPGEEYVLSDPEIVALLRNEITGSFSERRVVVAQEIVIFLRFAFNLKLGEAYDIWRSDNAVCLSCLPGMCNLHTTEHYQQCTLEFRDLPSGDFVLHSIWRTNDLRYGCIPYYGWQPAVTGITANRVVPSLTREVVLKILESRNAEFGFPLTSGHPYADLLCGWIKQEPPNDFMEWGRDPRLTPGFFRPTYHIFDTRTNMAVYSVYLQGGWGAQGFTALVDALATYLPGRHRLEVLTHGEARLTVLLLEDCTNMVHLDQSYDLTFASMARMEAAGRGVPVPPPDAACRIERPTSSVTNEFIDLCSAFGKNLSIEVSDAADDPFRRTRFLKLRQSVLSANVRSYHDEGPFITHMALLRFISRMEGRE